MSLSEFAHYVSARAVAPSAAAEVDLRVRISTRTHQAANARGVTLGNPRLHCGPQDRSRCREGGSGPLRGQRGLLLLLAGADSTRLIVSHNFKSEATKVCWFGLPSVGLS